jgi:uncharacterized protein (DUF1810 family)
MADDLDRFVDAQRGVWPDALAELRAGRKTSHWMWFVFPQIAGLGSSPMARRYAFAGVAEARAYLAHPVLGPRLREATEAMLAHAGTAPEVILGGIDALKLRSSMTLFEAAADDPALFARCLDASYSGARDADTLARL